MDFSRARFFASAERTLFGMVDWFQNRGLSAAFWPRGFGPIPIPLYIRRQRVDLNNSNFWER